MDRAVRRVILGITLVAFIIAFLPFLILHSKIKKIGVLDILINRDSPIYNLVRSHRLRNPGFWKGNWGYKLWLTAMLDFMVLPILTIFVFFALSILGSDGGQLTLMVFSIFLGYLIAMAMNVVGYSGLFKKTDTLYHRLDLLDEHVKEASTEDPNVLGHFQKGFEKASADKPLSSQDVRDLIIQALNLSKGKTGDLHKIYGTCIIVWYLHQLPPVYRYEAITDYLDTQSIQRYLTNLPRPIPMLDKTTYMKDTIFGQGFMKTKQWGPFCNQVDLALERINANLPGVHMYNDIHVQMSKYLIIQIVLRSILFFIIALSSLFFIF